MIAPTPDRPATPAQGSLASSYEHCRRTMRDRAGNFAYGIRLFPAAKRDAICALYAWSRAGDDITDDPDPARDTRADLAAFRVKTLRILDGAATADTDHWPAFLDTCRTYAIDREPITDMLDGLEQDLEPVKLRTWADLDRYCDRVASSVGRMCVTVWGPAPGVDPSSLTAPAIQRGRAFQLVNILRDIAEDYDATPSRVYIPEESLTDLALTPEALRAWSEPGLARRLVEYVASRARERFDRSAALESMVDPACVPGLVAMTSVYRGILARIERAPASVVAPVRVGLPAWQKTGIALRAVAGRLTTGWRK